MKQAGIDESLAGTWSNTSGRSATWMLKAADGKITGEARIPNSSYDIKSSVFKSYDGVRVNFQQSYGWGFSLTLRPDKLSNYRMYGTAKRRHWELDSELRKSH
jgi:hypothetical protein